MAARKGKAKKGARAVATKTVPEFLAAAPPEKRAALKKLRALIKSVAPKAAESISYGVIGFKHLGKPLVYLGYAKEHCALYGMGRGTQRFAPEKPPAASLVKGMLKGRLAEIEGAAAAKLRSKR